MEEKKSKKDEASSLDKREIILRFRVNEAEKKIISNRVDGDFSSWCRELVLGEKKKKDRKIKLADPQLLFELNKIGVNLNQIAKEINFAKILREDKTKFLLKLASIDEEIKKIREFYAR